MSEEVNEVEKEWGRRTGFEYIQAMVEEKRKEIKEWMVKSPESKDFWDGELSALQQVEEWAKERIRWG
jgi:2-oxo-4-hydroxy-4-carboxy--5-ureidoimidazoline (OHCU) decarboxylase